MITIGEINVAIGSGHVSLPLVVELGQHGLPALWANETDPAVMATLLFYTAILPVSLAIRVAELEADEESLDDALTLLALAKKIVKDKPAPRVYKEAFVKIGDAVQERWMPRNSPNGWMTVAHAIRAIEDHGRLGGDARNTQVTINDTILTATYADNNNLDREIVDLLRPFGPPTLAQIVAAAKAKR
jgi:hypothetical protein